MVRAGALDHRDLRQTQSLLGTSADMTDPDIAFNPLENLLLRPDLFAHKLDLNIERVLIVELSRALIREASFLDDRVLATGTRGKWVQLSSLRRILAPASPALPLHFIFHTGHVGSTLLSRMIESAGATVAVREPMPLRTLAEAHDVRDRAQALIAPSALDQLALDQMVLWSRGYEDTRAVIVKATSATGRLAPWLMQLRPTAKAVYLNLAAEPFLSTLLAGANSPTDLRGHGPERIGRLQTLAGVPIAPLHTLTLGELAALTWAVETLSQHESVQTLAGRVLAIDFEKLLMSPAECLRAVLEHFDVVAPPGHVERITQHEVFTRYAKATAEPYSPQIRSQILEDSRRRNAEEIQRGLRWIDAVAQRSPVVGRLLLA